jgi:hypothetical protein
MSQDGANWISRRMLRKLVEWRIKTEGKKLDKQQIKALRRMAAHSMRVELTFVNHEGQYKGHALVVNTREWDLMLIEGSQKPEVRTASKLNRVFISAEVKHTSELWLDRQSFTNLEVDHFFGDNLTQWFADYCQAKLDQFDSGDYINMITAMGDKARWATDANALLNYPIFNYVLSGGNPSWFASTTRQALRASLKGAHARNEDASSFILPGANYYVFPASVATDAGLDRKVGRGDAWLDSKYATIWVNDVDLITSDPSFEDVASLEKWLDGSEDKLKELQARAPGLMITWSRRDDDDMIRSFVYNNGSRDKVLAWRSPNQLGQYAVLNVASGSDYPTWCGNEHFVPEMDESKLPNLSRWEHNHIESLIAPYEMERIKEFKLGAVY